MYCPHCGEEIPYGVRFCGSCGEDIPEVEESEITSGELDAVWSKIIQEEIRRSDFNYTLQTGTETGAKSVAETVLSTEDYAETVLSGEDFAETVLAEESYAETNLSEEDHAETVLSKGNYAETILSDQTDETVLTATAHSTACPRCGSVISPEMKHCPFCGSAILDNSTDPGEAVSSSKAIPAATAHCVHCGAEIVSGKKFCTSCGADLTEKMTYSGTDKSDAGNSKKHKPYIFILLAVFLLSAVVAAVIFYQLFNKSAESTTQAESATQVESQETAETEDALETEKTAADEIEEEAEVLEETEKDPVETAEQNMLDGNYEAAVSAWTAVIEADPQNTDAYLGRAEAYLALYEENAASSDTCLTAAAEDYQTAVQLDPSLTEAWQALADLCLQLEDYEGAIAAFSGLIEYGEATAELYCSRAEARLAAGETVENQTAAAEDYQTAVQLDSTLTEAWQALADLYEQLEDYAGALEACSGLLESGETSADVYRTRAQLYLTLAETENAAENETAALADYQTVLESGEATAEDYAQAAEICILLKDYDTAAAILTEGLEEEPENTDLTALAEEVETLIAEKELAEQASAQRSEIINTYMGLLNGIADAVDAGVDTIGVTDWLGDNFREFADTLVQAQFWEREDGRYVGVYPGGAIYYGELVNGVRSGQGVLVISTGNAVPSEAGYIATANLVYDGTWSDDYPNGQGVYYMFNHQMNTSGAGTATYRFSINFVDGYADGTGTFYYADSDDGTSGECEIQAVDGVLQGLYTTEGNSYFARVGNHWFSGSTLHVSGASRQTEVDDSDSSGQVL